MAVFRSSIKGTATIWLALCLSAACGANPNQVEASHCFVLGVEEAERADLVLAFEEFASRKGFEVDDSHPQTIFYRKASEGTAISLQLFMGELGASASTFAETQECTACEEFVGFVQGELAKRYLVRECDDVEGFRRPVLWNVNPDEK